MTQPEQQTDQNPEQDADDNKIDKQTLAKMISGEIAPPANNHRVIAGIIIGAIVGFVEAGLPRSGDEWFPRSFIYVGLRIVTGLACAWVPWRVHSVLRGVVFSLVLGVPLFFTYGNADIARSIILAAISGLLIGYWTERLGISRKHHKSSDPIDQS